MSSQHAYLSTACLHGECGSCRGTCKFCGASCRHGCHKGDQEPPRADVDQARDIARELYQAADITRDSLRRRVEEDPALFWLRGEEQPPGEWRASDADPDVHVDWHMTPAEWAELQAVLTGRLSWDASTYVQRLGSEGKL